MFEVEQFSVNDVIEFFNDGIRRIDFTDDLNATWYGVERIYYFGSEAFIFGVHDIGPISVWNLMCNCAEFNYWFEELVRANLEIIDSETKLYCVVYMD